jgi:glycosyltransferase involved in cell wall biosynthesis
MVSELGLTPFFTFFGHQRDIASYISCYDISCLCSKVSEGCSNVILESMGLGKPVVVSDVGGNRELIGQDNCGILVPAREPEAFAKAVLTLLGQPDRLQEIGENGMRVIMERFSLNRMVNEYEQLYEKILKEKGIE